jgi:putative protease
MAIKKAKTKKKVSKRKLTKKRLIRRKPAKLKKIKSEKPKEKIIGEVTHYFPKVRAAVIKLKAPLVIGETVKITGHTTDFTQKVASIQIDHVPVNSAKKGQEIGLLVDSRVREHDIIYKEKVA